MTRATQGLVLAFIGAVLLRLSLSDAYLRYVAEWMKWPIAASGVLLLLASLGPILDLRGGDDEHAHTEADDHHHEGLAEASGGHDHSKVPLVTWLLVLPGLVVFVISPPALGSYLAERRANDTAVAAPAVVADLAEGEDVPLDVQEFIWRAQQGGETLADRTVALTGFVSHGEGGSWFVTRLGISCCAADAVSFRVMVEADPALTGGEVPGRDRWVTVSGTYVDGTGTDPTQPPAITAAAVEPTTAPTQTYE